MQKRPLCILMISPVPNMAGGVAIFAETLKKSLAYSDTVSLHVGCVAEQRWHHISRAIRSAMLLPRLFHLVRTYRFDIVHINPSLNYRSLIRDGALLLALRILHFHRVIVCFHGWDGMVAQRIYRKPMLRRFLAWLLNGTKRVMVLAPEFGRSLFAMGVKGSHIQVTSTLFDGDAIPASIVQAVTQRSILFMSRLDARKGIYELLEAFVRLCDDYPDVILVYAGSGKESERLRLRAEALQVSERIRFHGYVCGNEKASLLAACTIFALPTYYPEGMPVALLEAMAAGKPLLTSKAGGIRHIARDPENGVLLETITTETVEAGLRRMLDNSGYCERTGHNNRRYAWETFEAKRVALQIEAVYREVACRHV